MSSKRKLVDTNLIVRYLAQDHESTLRPHLDALHRYQKTRVHFVDCLIAATSTAQDMPVATFDGDFRKFADVRVENE
jgi:predicted nucleic-acid-binding protein